MMLDTKRQRPVAAVGAVALASVALVAGFALANVFSKVEAQGVPSSKAAIAIDSLIDLSQAAGGPPNSSGDTGWVDVLATQIKTPNQKDLTFDVAMQCGIVTDTTVKSGGGTQSAATARGNIAVRVLVDGNPA